MRQTRKRFYKRPKTKQQDSQSTSKKNSRSRHKSKKRPAILKLKKTTASMLKHAEFLETEQQKSSKSKPKSNSRAKDRLSEHFSKKDFLCKHCVEKKIEKKPFRISLGLIGALEKLRSDVKQRIEIIKGYECVESHELSKSFKKNYHTMGLAAIIQSKAPLELLLEKAIAIDEIKIIEINHDDNTLYLDTRKDPVKEIWEIKNKNKKNITDTLIFNNTSDTKDTK